MKRSQPEPASESHLERSVRKKTEKLKSETAKVNKELDALDKQIRRAKKEAGEDVDTKKTEFLRQAGVLRRRVDDYAAECQVQRDAMAREEPELNELRLKMQEMSEQHRERREILLASKAERLQLLYDEIEALEGAPREV